MCYILDISIHISYAQVDIKFYEWMLMTPTIDRIHFYICIYNISGTSTPVVPLKSVNIHEYISIHEYPLPMTIIDFPFISTIHSWYPFFGPQFETTPEKLEVFRRDQQHDKQYLDPCHVAT